MLLRRVIGYARMNTAKRINRLWNMTGTPVWRWNYYEHVICDEIALSSIREYITSNPLYRVLDEENSITIATG